MSTKEQVLVGRYELAQRIGVGGMAEVYHGKDRVLGRTVAVKTLLPQFAHDPSFIARFRREATSAASLNHPNIVGVYDSGSDDGRHFIVMEYVQGQTLKDTIREEGPLLPERAAEIAAEVCSALQFAHAHGIVHRDVKPANIMINSRGEVKVADFGIARAASGETVTQTATVLGTAQYFSPEQAQAAPVDARSDLYSLGVVLYEMLTRQVPFTGASPVAIAYKHVKDDPIPPSRLNADIPPSLEAVVMRALAKNPDNRYQSAQEMRQDLERAIRGLPVDAPRVMTPADHTAAMTAVGSPDETVMLRRGTSPTAPKQNRRAMGIALLSMIAAGMIAILVWVLIGLLPKSADTIRVPDVTGFPLEAAKREIEERGLRAVVGNAEASATVPSGNVIRTDPPVNESVDKGATVTIIPSSGKAKVKIPSIIGLQESAARDLITKAGLVVGTVTRQTHATRKENDVISSSPPPGTEVESGSRVDLVVSEGKGTSFVPSVIGKTEEEAVAELQQRGFTPVIVKESEVTCSAVPGHVCRQDPPGGEERPRGSNVTIYVAQDASEPVPTDSATPTESPGDG